MNKRVVPPFLGSSELGAHQNPEEVTEKMMIDDAEIGKNHNTIIMNDEVRSANEIQVQH